jgi:hypothetical protein
MAIGASIGLVFVWLTPKSQVTGWPANQKEYQESPMLRELVNFTELLAPREDHPAGGARPTSK